MSRADERRQARRALWEELENLPDSLEEPQKLPEWLLPVQPVAEQENWVSIGEIVERNHHLPNSGHFDMPEEVLPIAHTQGAKHKPERKKESKVAATMTLLRRLLAADLVLGNAIRKLDLAGHGIGDDGCMAVADVLLAGARVETLDLRGNEIADRGATHLAMAIEVSETIKHCILCNNKITSVGAIALTSAFKYSTTVEEWDLGSNNIGATGLNHILQGFLINRVVTVLALRDTLLEDSSLEVLSHATWGGLSPLMELDVSANSVGPTGCQSLCRMMLRKCCALQVLDLRDNKLGDEGAWLLAKALESKPTLRSLCLARCSIGDGGVCAIADALDSTSHLRALDFSQNTFGDTGAMGLATAIGRCSSLRLLDMSSEETTEVTAEIVVVAMRTVAPDRKLVVHLMTGMVLRGRADANKFTLPEDCEGYDEAESKHLSEHPVDVPQPIASAAVDGARPMCGRACGQGGCTQQ